MPKMKFRGAPLKEENPKQTHGVTLWEQSSHPLSCNTENRTLYPCKSTTLISNSPRLSSAVVTQQKIQLLSRLLKLEQLLGLWEQQTGVTAESLGSWKCRSSGDSLYSSILMSDCWQLLLSCFIRIYNQATVSREKRQGRKGKFTLLVVWKLCTEDWFIFILLFLLQWCSFP